MFKRKKRIVWDDVSVGRKFVDGSTTTQRHETHTCECYSIQIPVNPYESKELVVSEDHLLLCYTGAVDFDHKEEYIDSLPKKIPNMCDLHFARDNEGNFYEISEAVAWDPTKFSENLYWIDARTIHLLLSIGQRLFFVSDLKQKSNGTWRYNRVKPISMDYVGKKECFCISTSTRRYEVCGVVHHNSVTLRNIIFHSLTHSDDIKLGLVDLKLSEFVRFKGMNNIVGVANTTKEATELLRLCREVMQKRNKENAERGLTDAADYQPTKPTNKISLFGREFEEDTPFQVEIRGEQKTMTAGEILDWVASN